MTVFYVSYDLYNGFVHNWLVAGPQAVPVADLQQFQGSDFKSQIVHRHRAADVGIIEPPVQDAVFSAYGEELTWRYVRCQDDHLVDLTGFYDTCHYLRSWAYTRIVSPMAQDVTCVLTSNGPADVWLNGEHIHRQEHFYHQIPHSVSFRTTLDEGSNDILMRLEEVGLRECPFAVALQIKDLAVSPNATDGPVLIPTINKSVARRKELERVIDLAYLDRDTYTWDDMIAVNWPEDMVSSAQVAARLSTHSGRIYAEARKVGKPGDRAVLQRPYEIPEGAYELRLMPNPEEYYDWHLRVDRTQNLWSLRGQFASTPFGSYAERRKEALTNAASRDENVFSEIAKMALGRWSEVNTDAIAAAIEGINQRRDCSDFYLIGLLGMMVRFGDHPSFPDDLRQPLEDCVLGFRYWMDEPGSDGMCYWSENHQILFHACEILAGQLYPERIFSNAGQNGQWHRRKGERLAISWLKKRGMEGFREWDSNAYFEEDLMALSHLADLAESQKVWEMASIVMDKMFFAMALNSYKGVFGSTHGRSYASMIKGAHLEPTSGISRLMWGVGMLNQRVMGTVSLACVAQYELPSVIRDIALDAPQALWSRERHAGDLEEAIDCATGSWEVNKVTYKTPDYMLCSAQDYRPGRAGLQEHIWQATMEAHAVVFVTHPPCVSEDGSHRPNFWAGNVVLPRVAQWKDVLVAIHSLPENDWMGFTHAYFPLHAFDEHAFRDDAAGRTWAFARMGDGYLALFAARGLELIKRGDNALRELRSYGRQNVWLCHMGRAAVDGAFGDFQDQVLALEPRCEGLSVQTATLRDASLQFAWEGPLLVNGVEQQITGFNHYESPYGEAEWPAAQMDIRFGDQIMRLEFAD